MTRAQIYVAGKDAALTGKTAHHNPFEFGSAEAITWAKGFFYIQDGLSNAY